MTKSKKLGIACGGAFALLCVATAIVLLVVSVLGADPVSIGNNGSRLVAKTEDPSASVQWMIADEENGSYAPIDGAVGRYYDIKAEDEGKYIKLSSGGVESAAVGPIGKLVVLDLYYGVVSLGSTYSGFDETGAAVSGAHAATNLYVIRQSNNATSTKNGIAFANQNLASAPFDVTLDGINIFNSYGTKTPSASGIAEFKLSNIYINAPAGYVKHVTLRLKGENAVRSIYWSTGNTDTAARNCASTLKITDINGDGETEGGSLYIPKKVATEDIAAFVATNTNYNHWNAGIGGDDSSGQCISNLTFAGGFVQVLTTLGDNCSAIGGGGNGFAELQITGGHVVAHCNGTGAAIGGGIGWTSTGGVSDITITGGTVYAKNHGNLTSGGMQVGGVAIGSGSSFQSSGSTGKVTITGGTVEAYGTFGNGIGGGNSSKATGGAADVTITGGKVTATSIGGGNSRTGVGGAATVKVSGTADVTLLNGIGGGPSVTGTGGAATITVDGGQLVCQGTIGGGAGGESGAGGAATVTVKNGFLTAPSIGGGVGGASGNGGAANIIISGGTIETGSIGGGSTLNPTGKLGYATANISGGDITGQFIMAAGGTQPCTFTMTGGTLHGVNTADTSSFTYASQNGAAVFMDDPSGVGQLSGGSIEGCSAENGGAVYMTAGTFTVSGTGRITDCTATGEGGAVYMGGGSLTVSGGSIDACTAENGGGAYLGGGTLEVSGGTITECAATLGGGAYLGGGTLEISGGTISECDATVGGGAYLGGGLLSISGGSVLNNEATENGGGAYVNGGDVRVLGGLVTGNVSAQNGGGICVNNGNLMMAGGQVDGNTATAGSGGGIYISAYLTNVTVDVYSGSLSNNVCAQNGAALAVESDKNGTERIAVTVGAAVDHILDDDGNIITPCEHTHDELLLLHEDCPHISGNRAGENGGAIYATGARGADRTTLTLRCLTESDNAAGSETTSSDFMMLDGGTIILSSKGGDDHSYGNIRSEGAIHVAGGQVMMEGSLDYIQTTSPITVDIKSLGDYFEDEREAGKLYYTIEYYENFTDPTTGITTGRYRSMQLKKGVDHLIEGVMYSHDGFKIVGWFDRENSVQYKVGSTYRGEEGNLTLYAMWEANGYFVEFHPNVAMGDSVSGSMERVVGSYNTPITIPDCNFIYPGYNFLYWEDSEGTRYDVGDTPVNLSLVDGEVVPLYAVWELCIHEEVEEEDFIYTASGNVITKTCPCHGFRETATLTGGDTVYDTLPHPVEIVYSGEDWGLTVSYEKNGAAFEGVPTNAGTYTAKTSIEGAEASLEYTVQKAPQPTPDKPTFSVSDNVITVDEVPASGLGTETVYQLVYMDGNVPGSTPYTPNRVIVMSSAYTTYYVLAKYAGNDNYLDSEAAMSDSVYYYQGDVKVNVSCADGILYQLSDSDEDGGGLLVTVSAKDGWYLTSSFSVSGITAADFVCPVLEKTARAKYLITQIPDGSELNVNISGASELPKITGAITAGETFLPIAGNEASIDRYSAFTVAYELWGLGSYENVALAFGSAVPAGTSVILVDRTGATPTYWYYVASTAVTSVPLSSFRDLGGNTPYALPGTSAKLQFAVNFAETDGFASDSLMVDMSADSIGDAMLPALSELTPTFTVELGDVTFLLSDETQAAGVEKSFLYRYAFSADGFSSVKWQGRRAALVFRFVSGTVPMDAYLKVVENGSTTMYYPRAGGLFIVPLASDSGIVTVTMMSSLFDSMGADAAYTVDLVASESLAGTAALNGEVLDSLDTAFLRDKKEMPSVSVLERGDGDRVFSSDETLDLHVTALNMEGCTVTATMTFRAPTGGYTSTGWEEEVEFIQNQAAISVNLAIYSEGSYCLLLTVTDSSGARLYQVPHYFVIR